MADTEDSKGRSTDDLFLAALDLPPAERPAFLETACGDNQQQRTEIESMLAIADTRPDLLVPPDIGLIPEKLGRYEMLNECGRGGMGIVFEARDSQLLRTVALKVLPQFLSRDPRNLERFTREAQTLAGLNHPNIATLFSLDESSGFHFLTMEFAAGATLADVLATRSLSLDEALSLGLQVAVALEAAHAIGICHCDLKPANIMVSAEGKITLLDFGIARAFKQVVGKPKSIAISTPGASIASGTPDYMAPEQAAGQTVNEQTDLWALGVILFECLTGEHLPPRSDGDDHTWRKKLPDTAPPCFITLLQRCLVLDPGQRLASAKLARESIERLLRRTSNRNRILSAAGAFLLAAIVVMFLVFGRGPTGPLDRLENPTPTLLEGLNQQGEVLWVQQFDAPIRTSHMVRKTTPTTSPGHDEQSIGCIVTLWPPEASSTQNFLDPETGELIWNHQPAWTTPVNGLGPFRYRWTVVTNWDGREDPVILGGIRDGLWYSFAVEALSPSGELLGIYHHPGPLYPLNNYPVFPEQESGLLLYGANSSARFNRELVPFETNLHPGCVVLLRPSSISGQAFPYSENLPEHRDWPDLPKASEDAYLLIPLINPDHDSFVDHVESHHASSGRNTYTAWTRDGRAVILDKYLYPLKCIVQRDGVTDSLLQAGTATNTAFLHLRKGVAEWVDVPIER